MRNIKMFEPVVGPEEEENVVDCIRSNQISKGKYIGEFENKFAEYTEAKYAVSCNSGTSALHLAMLASGVGKDDQVIIPDLTFAATAFAVSYCGARPCFADVRHDSWCIDVEDVVSKITNKTRAILSVDLFGNPADYDILNEVATDRHIALIHDSCESLGATWHSNKIGSFNTSCFSFFGNKIITTGEGGMLTTDDPAVYRKVLHYRNNCMTQPYYHDDIGYNYRMDNIKAALGCAQLSRIEDSLTIKRKNALLYREKLKGKDISFQSEQPGANSNNWMVGAHFRRGIDINALSAYLKSAGIETRPFFTPMHMLSPYAKSGLEDLPVSKSLYERGLCLPSGAHLNEGDIQYISDKIKEVI